MRLFCRNKHASEDSIAFQIAEQYGVGEGYIRSRKQGMSPREALEDWDIDVSELKEDK
ncbi:MAG: hypothetical protein K6A32_07480 [Bacteroidales bacterium]|nr:hypothetical protein [Bacteroidales bacterium]